MRSCSECDEERKENELPLLRHMDPSQPECERCPLYVAREQLQVPDGCELAWRVYARLTSPAVQRFGLVEEALDALNLALTDEETSELLHQLDAIAEGLDKEQAAAAKRK